MKSWVAKTEEIDDFDVAIEELKQQLPLGELCSNTVGLAYIYYDADFEELSRKLKAEFDFPVLGMSSMALLDNEGYVEFGIRLLVMSAEDVTFSIGMVGALNRENFTDKVEELYHSLQKEEREKLIITYTCQMTEYLGDEHMRVLSELSGSVVPIYGAIAVDMYTYEEIKICFDGKVEEAGCALLLLHGNVEPITTVEFSVSNEMAFDDVVASADRNKVYTVGSKTFYEKLDEAGLASEQENVVMEFMQTPFLAEIQVNEKESVEVLRNLVYLDKKEGFGRFVGEIPCGSKLKIATLKSDDIGQSVTHAFENLLQMMAQKKGYQYSTIICTSCLARYMNLVGDKNMEGDAYKDIIPEGINLAGMYSSGEFCSKKGKKTDAYYNMFYNETFTILAL